MGLANSNAPFGLRPISENGGPFTGQGRLVYFPTAQGANIFLGDPLVYLGGTDAFGVPAVGIATAGATHQVAGGFNGLSNGPAGSGVTLLQNSTVYRPASTITYGLLADDPNQLFAIQEDSVGGAIAAGTSALDNADLVAGAGSTVTGFSGWQLDSSTVGSGATMQVKIMGLLRGPDNALGINAKWVVRLNLAQIWTALGA